jgi:transposase
MENINPNDIIVIDESGANLGMTSDYARAEGGQRAKAPKPGDSGQKYSMIGAITLTAILSVTYLEMAVNSEIFQAFIENFLIKKLGPGKYVVLDNVKFHKNKTVINMIEATGAKVVFLPPYSPDLSPIEKMWSKIKTILKQHKPRTDAEFYDALAIALHAVNSEDLENWYQECGYAA